MHTSVTCPCNNVFSLAILVTVVGAAYCEGETSRHDIIFLSLSSNLFLLRIMEIA